MTQTAGYPAQSVIDTFLAARGIESITENNVNFIEEWKQLLWNLLNSVDFAISLGVHCPTPTTFNVRGGRYNFKGEVKTYAAGDAVNPADNDTTYIWMNADNTIGSAIDGTGWPATEHIPLASITVDSEGVITNVTDLRGQTFLNYAPSAICKLATVTAGMQTADGKTTLFTVPTGKKFIPAFIIVRNPTASLADGVDFDFGDGANADTWRNTIDLSSMTAVTDFMVIGPITDTPVKYTVFDAGDAFGVRPVTGSTADANAIIEVFGYLFDA